MTDKPEDTVQMDTTPVDTWVGVPLGGGQMKDPVAPNDIRRWAQGMQNSIHCTTTSHWRKPRRVVSANW